MSADFFNPKRKAAVALGADGENSNGSVPSAKAGIFGASSSASKAKDPPRDQPWVEKYRPRKISDVAAQEETVAVLKKALESKNLPHLLFYGPPGTGKTSTILALARELFGPELIHSRVLELNASDERGISIVREKVKNFAKTTVTNAVPGYPCPPYKIIILDEADSMTKDAQAALRRTMETYSKMTRFCLICNYVSRVIDPLASRCAKFRFKPLPSTSTAERLEYICSAEALNYNPDSIKMLVETSEGDMRKAVTYLQTAARLNRGTRIEPETITEIAGTIPMGVISNFVRTSTSAEFEAIEECVRDVILDGYSGAQLISQLFDYIMTTESITSAQKSKIAQRLGAVDKCLCDGADEHLQLLNLGSYMRTVCR